jgi:hypothetical protein
MLSLKYSRVSFLAASTLFILGPLPGWTQVSTGTGGGTTGGGLSQGGGISGGGGLGGTGSGSIGFGPGTTGAGTSQNTGFGGANLGTQGTPGSATGTGGILYPTTVNPFRTTYANPLGMGMSVTFSKNVTVPKAAFGQPLYGAITSTTTNATGLTGQGNITGSTATGFSTIGIPKTPPYITTLSDTIPLVPHPPTQLTKELQEVLARSNTLKSRNNIAVTVEGFEVFLRGQVPTQHERRLAESLIRLTPGVREVHNELEVAP